MMRKPLRQHKPVDAATATESVFSFTLARVAVAQICQSMGFKGTQNPALEALTDIATRYLKAIARLAATSANSNGRTQSNLLDIICALEDLASVQGFQGSSCLRSHSLYSSSVIMDLMKFVQYTDEIPFAQPLPPRRNFSRATGRELSESGDKSRFYCDDGSLRHVPRWLPDVPVVEEKEKAEETKREVKWGCLDGRQERKKEILGCGELKPTAAMDTNDGIVVSQKRGKVRFKLGTVGNLRGVGIRKRVWCE